MKDPYKRRYLYLMLSIFGAISLSIVVFFAVYRFQGLGHWVHSLTQILAPFIYGGVVAYLLRPICSHYERFFQKLLPKSKPNVPSFLAVGLSLVTGLLIVYALIIMIAPQLYHSIVTLWNSLPDKVSQFLTWARATFGEDEELLQLFNMIYTDLYAEVETW